MHSKCDRDVEARVREAERRGEPQEIAVLVTLRPGASWETLERHGLLVHRVFEDLHAVSGSVQTPRLRDLAALDGVLRIEFDGEVRALPADGE